MWSFYRPSKSFDTVNHESLLVKLDFYGIHGLDNSWLKSFLENRKQCVDLPEQSSSVKTVTYGVPQGSTLGLLFFLFYINDLHWFIIFADDTNLLFPAKELVTIKSVINYELKLLVKWLQINKLSF